MECARVFVLTLCFYGCMCIGPNENNGQLKSRANHLSCFVSEVDLDMKDPVGSSFTEEMLRNEYDHQSLVLNTTLHCFEDVNNVVEEDPLGCSLLESPMSFMIDELGCSLTEERDQLNLTDHPHDLQMEDHNSFNQEVILSGNQTQMYTSTPKKAGASTDLNFIDVEEYSCVLASPFYSRFQVGFLQSVLKGRMSKLQEKALSHQSIMNSLSRNCKCKSRCMDKVDFRLIYCLRYEYWTKAREQRKQWLLSKLKSSQKCGHYTYIFLDNGQGICLKALEITLRINKNTLTEHRALASREALSIYPAIRETSVKTVECISWFESYASMYADRMPNTKDILLPYRTVKKHVYETYKTEIKQCVSESTFYGVWTRHFPHVKVKKSNSFSQCTKCAILQRKFESTLCPVSRLQLRKERSLHNQRQMLERKCYYSKRQASKQHPDDFLSLIIDGMDQSKTDLPHFVGRQAKSINPAALLKTHITGVISHGHGLFASYLDILEYPHDPNLTINVILKVLGKISQLKGCLPPVLYLQMDNSPRDNKNKYVFGFCEALVRQKVFNEVQVSFLYVGHTHEDIDASFSKISEKLRKHDAETIPQLLNLVKNLEDIGQLWDVKDWLADSLTQVTGISEPLHFKINRNKNKVCVLYKGQQHQLWTVLNGRGTFLREMPTKKIKKLQPNFNKILDKLDIMKKQIMSIKYMFRTEDNYNWWLNFLKTFQTSQKSEQTIWLSQLPKQQNQPKQKDVYSSLDPALRKMLEKETAVPQLSCEKLRKLKASSSKQKSSRKVQSTASASKVVVALSRKSTIPTVRKISSCKMKKGRRNLASYKTFLLIQLDSERKQHIWIMIFIDLLGQMLLLLFFILEVLIMMRSVEYLFYLLNSAWNVVLFDHMGLCMSKVAAQMFVSCIEISERREAIII